MGSKDQFLSSKLVDAALRDSSVESVWKMYSGARASLPYRDRIDNLTWRMLGMRVRRREVVSVESGAGWDSVGDGMDVDPMLGRSPGELGEPSGLFLSSAGVNEQFSVFDGGFDEQLDDQLLVELSRSSPAIASETSDSYAKDVVGGSLLADTPDHNFLDHFFPSSIMGDGSDSVVPAVIGKPKKVRQQNCTVTQSRRGSGVKKKTPVRNASTTSLNSLTGEESGREPVKEGKNTRCSNCHTRNTPLWRRDPAGNPLCNACGLFLKLHGVVRPLSLKTDVIKKRQRNSNTSKQSKSTSPNLEDPRQTRKTAGSSGSRRKSTARETSSVSPVTVVNPNLESSNDVHNFNDNINNNTNDDNNNNNSHFEFFPQADLSTMEDSRVSSHSSNVDMGIERPSRDDESRPQRNDATGNTNWEWLSLSL
ncbi:hypothetical protein HG537_0B06400 [Torulaspora globosa]|uniref:GATA-type domain-containing protein n=1 Tax=Torulaspora globosa TaxID=48254 RepID=A0A7H9HSG3_9SACH|nr:hypothetical protein HG537_0B06400 [Torulaspora sp. CBS 2947]